MGLQKFLLLALFGLVAEQLDGSLGMAYGLTYYHHAAARRRISPGGRVR